MTGELDTRMEVVNVGGNGNGPNGTVAMLACTKCGVLIWDIDAHWSHAHAVLLDGTV